LRTVIARVDVARAQWLFDSICLHNRSCFGSLSPGLLV